MGQLFAMRLSLLAMTHVPLKQIRYIDVTEGHSQIAKSHAWLAHKQHPRRAAVFKPSCFSECMNELMCAHEYSMYEHVHVQWVSVDCRSMHSLCKCVWISPLRMELLHFRLCMCWRKKQRYTTGGIMKSERQLGNWSGYQSLPLCLCVVAIKGFHSYPGIPQDWPLI